MRRVVVDANVFVSLLTGRHEKQYGAAQALMQEAEDGTVVAILPQFVVFEVTYVLQSLYDVSGDRLASMIRDLVSFPGVQTTDDCPWRHIFEIWPNTLPGLADASIVAIATANRYDAVATFDRSSPTASNRSASPGTGSPSNIRPCSTASRRDLPRRPSRLPEGFLSRPGAEGRRWRIISTGRKTLSPLSYGR
jgi:predicted nucleic acid-binding protein